MICKNAFLYYRFMRNNNFSKESCCLEFITIDGETITFCLICFMKDLLIHSSDFFKHFRLEDEFRGNGLYLYMQLPVRTYSSNTLC